MPVKIPNFFYAKTAELDPDTIKGEWSLYVDDAAAYGNDFVRGVAYILNDMKVPGLRLAYMEGKIQFSGAARQFLLIGSDKLPLYRLYLAATPYGTRLHITLYMTEWMDNWGRFVNSVYPAQEEGKDERGFGSWLLLFPMAPVIMVLNSTAHRSQGYWLPAQFSRNKDAQEQLAAFTDTVLKVVRKASEELLLEMNLDFSQEDLRTSGFFNAR